MPESKVDGAFLWLRPDEVLLEKYKFARGYLLGTVTSRQGRFYATLLRVSGPDRLDAKTPKWWSPFQIDSAICGSSDEAHATIELAVANLVDCSSDTYAFTPMTD